MCGFTSGLFSVFMPVPYCLYYCRFVVEPQAREPDCLYCFSFLRSLWLFGVFGVFIQIVNKFCSNFVTNSIGNLIGDCIESVDCFG